MRYMSIEQVQQVAETHAAFLERQLDRGRITDTAYEDELRELNRWYKRHSTH